MNGARAAFLMLALAACGGGGSAPPASAPVDLAQIYSRDAATGDVTLVLVAGFDPVNHRWNFSGLHAGRPGGITVPVGARIEIRFENGDPTQPHSLAIVDRVDKAPATFTDVVPAFDGAATAEPNLVGTAPGGTETITFVAGRPGRFSIVCMIAGHALQGMAVPFDVVESGPYGVSR